MKPHEANRIFWDGSTKWWHLDKLPASLMIAGKKDAKKRRPIYFRLENKSVSFFLKISQFI